MFLFCIPDCNLRASSDVCFLQVVLEKGERTGGGKGGGGRGGAGGGAEGKEEAEGEEEAEEEGAEGEVGIEIGGDNIGEVEVGEEEGAFHSSARGCLRILGLTARIHFPSMYL